MQYNIIANPLKTLKVDTDINNNLNIKFLD